MLCVLSLPTHTDEDISPVAAEAYEVVEEGETTSERTR
jgi:hypothetical protein